MVFIPEEEKQIVSRKNKNYYQKKQSDPEYKRRKHENTKAHRAKKKTILTASEKLILNQNEKKRIATYRKKKKDLLIDPCNEMMNVSSIYKRKQTFGKALQKTRKSLPKSLKQKLIVICTLAKENGIDLPKNVVKQINTKQLDTDIVKKVKDFYFQPNIVYTCPGMRDFITVWSEGKKYKLQKHYLLMFLKEAYALFLIRKH